MELGEGSMMLQEKTMERSLARKKGEVSVDLPEELEEKILSKLPFPEVFKVQGLSKAWQARLSLITSQDVQVIKEGLQGRFQKHLVESSSTWKTFCPLLIGEDDFFGYDQDSCQWRRMPWLSFLSKKVLSFLSKKVCLGERPDWLDLELLVEELWKVEDIEGALILVRTQKNDFFVANVLTQSCKQLPSPPLPVGRMLRIYWGGKLINTSSNHYKVILFYEDAGYFAAYIYDSKLQAWRSIENHVSLRFMSQHAYLDGVFYWMVRSIYWVIRGHFRIEVFLTVGDLLAFDLHSEKFKGLSMQPVDPVNIVLDNTAVMHFTLDLVICNAKLLLIVYNGGCFGDIKVMAKLDLKLRKWDVVTREPIGLLTFGKLHHRPASDGESLYFLYEDVSHEVLAYNLGSNDWSRFPIPAAVTESYTSLSPQVRYKWSSSSFQPGLNPFIRV